MVRRQPVARHRRVAAVAAVGVCVLAAGCRESLPSAQADNGGVGGQFGPSPSAVPSTATSLSSANEVATGLADKGEPVQSVIVFDKSTDPGHQIGVPGGYADRASFADTRLTPGVEPTDEVGDIESGGTIEVFDTAADATSWVGAGKVVDPVAGEHDILSDTVLLRLSPRMTASEVDDYRVDLEDVTGRDAKLLG